MIYQSANIPEKVTFASQMLGSPKSDIELYVIGKVKEFRQAKNISQAALADALGVSYGFIGAAESPKYREKYNLNHIRKLADFFECSPKDFLPDSTASLGGQP